MPRITTDARFLEAAIDLVADYTDKYLKKTNHSEENEAFSDDVPERDIFSDNTPEYEVFVEWYSMTLQHFNARLSTTLFDGMHYEVIYNGDTDELYLNVYKEVEKIRQKVY